MEVRHGEALRLEDIRAMRSAIKKVNDVAPFELAVDFTEVTQPEFDFLFAGIAADPNNRLPDGADTNQALKNLGAALVETATDGDSIIPAVFTYLGQFMDHDITLEATTDRLRGLENVVAPLSQDEIRQSVENERSPFFDLDSVYETAPRDETDANILKIGAVSPVGNRPPGKETANDLPRVNAVAQIGDARNDENTIVAQLHTSFLRFHRAIVQEQGVSFDEARQIAVQHYQSVILHDFLPSICDEEIVNEILAKGNRFFKPEETGVFMPIEFSVAAYRFGHTLVRERYNFNLNFGIESNPATLEQLFIFSQHSGDIFGLPTLPENWIIQWERFLNEPQMARAVNTRLVPTLFNLKGPGGGQLTGVFQKLAQRNLLRGFLFGLPTGQALARHILGEQQVLTPDEILANSAEGDERNALEAGNFHHQTPLWYYILAESSIRQNGEKLGALGSIINAETIIGLLRVSPHSILQEENWLPTLPTADGTFRLADLLRFADSLS